MKLRLRDFSFVLFGAMSTLIGFGVTAIASAGAARGGVFTDMWRTTLATAAFGLVLHFALAFLDYRRLLEWCALPAYGAALAALVAVLAVGSTIYGGRRWLWFFQPSEISKLCIILFLAQFFGRAEERFKGQFGFRGFLVACLIAGIPCLLILLEPDLGTALTLVPAITAMLLTAGVWRRGLILMLVLGSLAGALVLGAVYEAEKPGATPRRREEILRYVPLKAHQVARVKTFLFPGEDPRGAGYNLAQAKISIGTGGLSGKGIGKGENNRLKNLPPSVSMNDFIFCVWAEETGFLGSLALLGLFALVCLSGIRIAWCATDMRGRLAAVGVSVLLFAHVYINIGMAIGLVPITGLPLPFISSGRTFLVTVMCALGIVQSISLHNKEELA
ncbi:MAG TPA: hypothetical protein DD637_06035 [Verrucomicrobia bacterium]|nr:hypothetical protein [Verrucomicrobiota bacterium]